MNDELRAAAEQLLRVNGSVGVQPQSVLLAKAWLAEHPADDEGMVTEEWLRSVGSESIPGVAQHVWRLGLFVKIAVYTDGSLGFIVDKYKQTLVDRIVTRGDVRRLCRALGIELKEAMP